MSKLWRKAYGGKCCVVGGFYTLNIHFHMLFLDGVYEVNSEGVASKFHAIEVPTSCEMQRLLQRISERIARLLERLGYLERDTPEGSLLLDGFDDDVINHLQGSSITYRIAVGSQRGKKVFTLKTLLASGDDIDEIKGQTLANGGGFSFYAGVSAKSYQRTKLSDYVATLQDLRYLRMEWSAWRMVVSVTH